MFYVFVATENEVDNGYLERLCERVLAAAGAEEAHFAANHERGQPFRNPVMEIYSTRPGAVPTYLQERFGSRFGYGATYVLMNDVAKDLIDKAYRDYQPVGEMLVDSLPREWAPNLTTLINQRRLFLA